MARCYCPSQGEGSVRMVTHLPGCGFLEDLIGGSCCSIGGPVTPEPVAPEPREPGPDELALADTYRRHSAGLAELDDAYADDSWRTWT